MPLKFFIFFSPVIDTGDLYMYLFYQDYFISSIITFLLRFDYFRIHGEWQNVEQLIIID